MKTLLLRLALLSLLLVSLLAGCSAAPAETAVVAEPTQAVPADQPADQAYPAYLAPDQPMTGTEDYPAPGDSTPEVKAEFFEPGQLPTAPADAPAPESGKASISGVFFSYIGNQTLPELLFYLTAASGPNLDYPPPFTTGPNAEKGDIQGYSDAKGQISLNNIPPGRYFLFVWSAYNWPLAVVAPSDVPQPRLIELKADQALPLGVIYIPWP